MVDVVENEGPVYITLNAKYGVVGKFDGISNELGVRCQQDFASEWFANILNGLENRRIFSNFKGSL